MQFKGKGLPGREINFGGFLADNEVPALLIINPPGRIPTLSATFEPTIKSIVILLCNINSSAAAASK